MDIATVKHMAHLARLSVSEQDAERLSPQLTSIMEMIDKMQQVDTSKVPPMAQPFQLSQPLRTDEVTETDQREQLQQGAPEAGDGFYWVPQVIE